MKRFYLLSLIALGAVALGHAQTNGAYIVPFHSDGTVTQEGDTYPEAITMTAQADGSYFADNVSLDFGFLFYMVSEGGGTLYRTASWAVTPVVEVLPNPLAITTQQTPIEVAAGTYDISLYDKAQSGYTYKLFTLTPVERERTYPASVYLIYGTGTDGMQVLTGDGTGIYQGVLNTTSPFVISYEPRNNDIFRFGPVAGSNVDLEEGVKVPIAYAKGINANFASTLQRETPPEITVSLVDGDSYILLGDDSGSSALKDVELAPEDGGVTQYYTLSGTMVAQVAAGNVPALAPGVYIVRCGTNVQKRFIGR